MVSHLTNNSAGPRVPRLIHLSVPSPDLPCPQYVPVVWSGWSSAPPSLPLSPCYALPASSQHSQALNPLLLSIGLLSVFLHETRCSVLKRQSCALCLCLAHSKCSDLPGWAGTEQKPHPLEFPIWSYQGLWNPKWLWDEGHPLGWEWDPPSGWRTRQRATPNNEP